MTCEQCGAHLVRRIRRRYPYTDSGLTGVFLRTVPVYVCRRHGVQAVVLRGLDRIHGGIKWDLLNRGTPFTPAEVRFLRKYDDWTQDELADRLGVHKITVAKRETGRAPIGPAYQRLLYLLFKDPHEFRKARPRVRPAKTAPISVPLVRRPGKTRAAPASRRAAAIARRRQSSPAPVSPRTSGRGSRTRGPRGRSAAPTSETRSSRDGEGPRRAALRYPHTADHIMTAAASGVRVAPSG